MRNNIVSGIHKYLAYIVVLLTVLISACSTKAVDDATNILPPCRPCDPKGASHAGLCTCQLSDTQNPAFPACCTNFLPPNLNPCGNSAPTALTMGGTCEMPSNQQISLLGAELTTVDNVVTGSFHACQPFLVVWQYTNFGSLQAEPPVSGIGPKLRITESPADIVTQPFTPVTKDMPLWSSLAPNASEIKMLMFDGIKPDNDTQSGTFHASFMNVPMPSTVSDLQFNIGLTGSDCP
jgi:hypothetical protein